MYVCTILNECKIHTPTVVKSPKDYSYTKGK
jgi:hypothetical protein